MASFEMPHRVANFFRSSNENINNLKATVQRRKSPNPNKTQPRRPREGTVRRVSYASSSDEDAEHSQPSVRTPSAPAVKMAESGKKEKESHHHRLSFPGLHLGGSKAPKEQPQHPYASLDWRIESPPAMMHGDTESSTGALVSGQMVLKVKDIPLEVESFTARLNIHVTQKKPFQGHCSDCATQKTELKSWTFLSEPTTLTPRRFLHAPYTPPLPPHPLFQSKAEHPH